ncbi:hypothetical protein BDL97_14G047900 [Sphagnum fallax]|nr:hypothetical protein BDL97_14G047900 [Sphagnum fallax]
MALVMAENEQPVFRDFLGLDRGVTSKQQQQQQQRQAEECYTSATTTTTSDVILRATSRSSVGFDSEGDVGTNRGSSETGSRFETSSAPGYIAPPFGLALPSSSDPGSVGWQRYNSTSSLHQQQPGMMRSAFLFKPDFDSSNSSKAVSNKKKREYGSGNGSRESSSLQERLQTSVEAIENCRPPPPTPKMPRINQENINVVAQKRCIPEVLPSIDDLRLSMQPSMQKPPRLSSVSPPWLQQQQQQQPSSCKVPEAQACNRNAMKQQQPEVPRLLHSGNNNNSGSLLQVLTPLPPSLRISHLGACAEREESRAAAAAAVVVSRDNNTGMSPPIITRPAADEGSQTGLKGSSLLAGLINNNNSTPAVPAAGSSGPPPLPRRPVKPSPSGGSADSILPSTTRQGPPPATRKLLTIFYGGQAHVFDDVPSNKAEAILAMAGSHGKSWSSTYSPRPAASVPDSAQEGSLSALEKEKTVQSLRGGSVSGGRGLPLSTDVQALLRGCVNTANGTGRPT